MPIIYKEDYGQKPLPNGWWMEITPTRQRFYEADGTDVRLDRVRIYDPLGRLVHSFLQDKMGQRFMDNLPGTEDDPSYLERLPSRNFQPNKEKK
jgi:hypothetical protein